MLKQIFFTITLIAATIAAATPLALFSAFSW